MSFDDLQIEMEKALVEFRAYVARETKEKANGGAVAQQTKDALSEITKRIDDLQITMDRPAVGGHSTTNPRREMRAGEVRILAPNEKLADVTPAESGLDGVSLGRVLRAQVLGRNSFLNEVEGKILNEGVGSAGGFTVPTPLSSILIDLARAKSVVTRAGAVTIPMQAATLAMARLAQDATGGWTAENAIIAASDMVFEKVVFTARTLACLCKMSVELFEDGANIDQVVSDAIAAALALEMDRAALVGDGSGAMPLGLYNSVGVQTLAGGGPLTNYVKLIAAYRMILEQNGSPNAMVLSPRTWGAVEGFVDTLGNPLAVPKSIATLPQFVSNQVPVNLGGTTNESPVIIGDFSQMMIGLRTNLTIEASRVAADGVSRAFESKQVFVRAYLRCDIQLAHPKHFVKVTGITP